MDFSERPDKRDFPYTPEAFVKALAAFVDALGLDKFHVVAQGFLGTGGIQYALQNPDRVGRLVNCECAHQP